VIIVHPIVGSDGPHLSLSCVLRDLWFPLRCSPSWPIISSTVMPSRTILTSKTNCRKQRVTWDYHQRPAEPTYRSTVSLLVFTLLTIGEFEKAIFETDNLAKSPFPSLRARCVLESRHLPLVVSSLRARLAVPRVLTAPPPRATEHFLRQNLGYGQWTSPHRILISSPSFDSFL
jgi:hypothetical protein